mgnify:CR=1 FL=1
MIVVCILGMMVLVVVLSTIDEVSKFRSSVNGSIISLSVLVLGLVSIVLRVVVLSSSTVDKIFESPSSSATFAMFMGFPCNLVSVLFGVVVISDADKVSILRSSTVVTFSVVLCGSEFFATSFFSVFPIAAQALLLKFGSGVTFSGVFDEYDSTVVTLAVVTTSSLKKNTLPFLVAEEFNTKLNPWAACGNVRVVVARLVSVAFTACVFSAIVVFNVKTSVTVLTAETKKKTLSTFSPSSVLMCTSVVPPFPQLILQKGLMKINFGKKLLTGKIPDHCRVHF